MPVSPDTPPDAAAGRTVVVGYDGSPAARAGLEFAAGRAGPRGTVVVVHSYALPPDFLGMPTSEEMLIERQRHGAAVLDAIPLEGSELVDVEYITELIGGPPAEAIVAVAKARHADEIVVGSRGFSRLRAALGSTSHEVLHLADRPVVVIPQAAIED